ncbi:MAG: 50S ribosomal protein L28 [candidate division WS1 bacterium]|nr:50S ribosomal protein L28 [candidate division WS1 bacterium]
MAKVCRVCGKKTSTGSKVSNSMRHTKRTFEPNLQRIRIRQQGGGVKRTWVCTGCIRANKVQKA